MVSAEERQRKYILEHLGSTRRVDGLLVIVRCTRVVGVAGSRFEIHIQGNSEIGVYDVGGEHESLLDERIEELIEAFLASYKLRDDWGV